MNPTPSTVCIETTRLTQLQSAEHELLTLKTRLNDLISPLPTSTAPTTATARTTTRHPVYAYRATGGVKVNGKILAGIRLEKGISQRQLGNALQPAMKQTMVSSIERGITRPTAAEFEQICSVLGVSYDRIRG